jgi:4-hydroxybenzoyl-CoA reductase subunit beta
MLRLPPLSFRLPGSIEEALAILDGEGSEARLVAGGTDLLPNMKRRHQHATTLVSLMGIPGLAGVVDGNGSGLRIGGTTTLSTVADHAAVRARYPALARAIESISSPPLRNMGTLGGNLCLDTRCTYYNQTEEWRRSIDYCMKEAGKICWVATSSPRCWAHSASDAAPMLCALGATVRLASRDGEREIPLAGLYRDDGIDYLTKRPDDVLVDVHVPAEADAAHCRTSFWKLRRRGSIDFAVLSVAAAVWLDPAGVVECAALWLGAVGSAPRDASVAAASLVGNPLGTDSIARAAELAKKAATPMDNTDFQTQWRKAVVARYVEAALGECAGLPVERLPRH